MSQFLDYKRQYKVLLIVLVLLIPTLLFFPAGQVEGRGAPSSPAVGEIKGKIEERNADIQKLEAEIKAYQDQLNVIGSQKNTLSGEVKLLDITRKKLNADISVTQNKIENTNAKIEGLSSDIGTKEDSISNNLDAIALHLKVINEYEISTFAEQVLSEDDFSDIWNDIDNMATLREEIRTKIRELQHMKGELEDTRTITIDAKNELTQLRSRLADQKKIVDQNAKEKNQLLAQTKNSEANYQKLLKDQIAKKTAFEKELQDYESQLKFILDPTTLPGKGVLSWPLDNIFITQLFGKTVAAKRLYASGSHSGVDFRASIGTPVKSMADGVVMGTGDTDKTCVGTSFGKWILIKYNNGLSSAFGHLSLIKVKEGNEVKRGDIVGYSGNTGHTTGPHLHVTVYVSSAAGVQQRPSTTCGGKVYTMPLAPTTAYLDPLYYLPKLPN